MFIDHCLSLFAKNKLGIKAIQVVFSYCISNKVRVNDLDIFWHKVAILST